MPKNVLPDAARVLPKAGQSVWLKAFNEALDKGMPESEASQFAWAAVKRAGYSKGAGGKWGKSMDSEFVLNEDGTFEMGVPLMKVNVQKRIVEGFATLNNVDQANDIVDMEASLEAFSKWFGNIREMHQPMAVGKAIEHYAESFTDPQTGQNYEGIWVRAKISKGAEDTWQKVLDGTLAGFSIGGVTQEKEREFVKGEDGTDIPVWKITKYRLTELSLVDNPCNRLATISLAKSIDGGSLVVEDVIADGDFEKSFDCETGTFCDLSAGIAGVVTALESWRDDAIRAKADKEVSYASELLGVMRSKLRYERDEADYHSQMDKSEDTTTTNREENTMTIEKSESTEELQDNEISATNGVEETAFTSEDVNVITKFINFIKGTEAVTDSGDESLVKTEDLKEEEPEMNEDVTKAIDEAVTGASEELTKSVDGKFDQVGESLTKITELLEKVATTEAVTDLEKSIDEKIEALAARVEAVETGGSLKKSADDAASVSSTEEDLNKSEGFWSDSILPEFITKGAK